MSYYDLSITSRYLQVKKVKLLRLPLTQSTSSVCGLSYKDLKGHDGEKAVCIFHGIEK